MKYNTPSIVICLNTCGSCAIGAHLIYQGEILTQTKTGQFPDFFIVGAPRCGTTSISRYLSLNPQVCFSRPKEPHYFARLNHIPAEEELKQNYMDPFFPHYTASHRVLGEGSVSYLYEPGAIEKILHLNPDSRFIVMVRNPLKMLPSYHLRMRYLLQEDKADFETAWNLEPVRRKGEQIPDHCLEPRVLFYKEVASLGAQVERLIQLAGAEQTHVIVFDDLVNDTLGVYQRALEFLGVDYDDQMVFKRSYESRIYRYHWLQKMFFLPVKRNGEFVDALQRRTRKYNEDGTRRKSLLKRIIDLNRVQHSPDPLTAQMAVVVSETLRPDVELLSRLLNRDLSHWLDE